MELIQIGQNSLKVMLTREDMQYYDIEFESLDYANEETRRAIARILAEAKRKVGFSAERESLYIQAFSDNAGGCELFVRVSGEREVVYTFDEISLLLYGCARLHNCGYTGESRAYIGEDGEVYLKLHLPKADETFLFLGELGRRLPKERWHMPEHARVLCDNAVETLSRLC